MKVEISANGKNLESSIDERFGQCRHPIGQSGRVQRRVSGHHR